MPANAGFVVPAYEFSRYSAYFHGGYRPKLAVSNCGDFSNEHVRLGISEQEYKEMLRQHYQNAGYKSLGAVSPYVMWKLF